jgi:hypothetical protein
MRDIPGEKVLAVVEVDLQTNLAVLAPECRIETLDQLGAGPVGMLLDVLLHNGGGDFASVKLTR